jgi:hypothetical protein
MKSVQTTDKQSTVLLFRRSTKRLRVLTLHLYYGSVGTPGFSEEAFGSEQTIGLEEAEVGHAGALFFADHCPVVRPAD